MGTRIALAGNPNCGKTTMFNALTGSSQYVGNWPGVTVEKKEGKYARDKDVILTDLPGVYSLSPYSPEEVVTRDYLMSGEPDVVINLVDATNLERNLYLATQIIDLGIPTVLGLNMADLVEKSGDKIDIEELSSQLGCPVIKTSALKKTGLEELVDTALVLAKEKKAAQSRLKFDDEVEAALSEIAALISDRVYPHLTRWYSIKLFEGEEKSINELKLSSSEIETLDKIRERLEDEHDDDAESIITGERYEAITDLVSKSVKRSAKSLNTTQKIDKIVTNRWLGLPIFILLMTLVYYISVSTVGTLATNWANEGLFGNGWLYTGNAQYEQALGEWEISQSEVDAYISAAEKEGIDTEGVIAATEAEEPSPADEKELADFIQESEAAGVVGEVKSAEGETTEVTASMFENALVNPEPDPAEFGLWVPGLPEIVGGWLESIGAADWIQSLIVDGIIGGVGAVLGFVPQLIVLFLLLTFLEGCGYMARVAFLMDRIFRKFGLSGKSFIPMLIASGCGVPAVMATKTIENEKDRRMTIMTTTMIPCGAKLPIIALVFGAIAGGDTATSWWIAPLFYFLGVFAIIISGIMLKKTKMFAGEATPFIMELPKYHLPALKNLLLGTWERVKSFIVKAGTIIFLSSIVIWFLLNFGFYEGQFGLLNPEMENYIQYSLMAAIGGGIAWLFAPLGFGDWESTVASITGLVAKENVVATLGVLFNLGDTGGVNDSMWSAFALMLGGSIPAIMAFCAFNLLCAPCFAAIGAIRRQMNNAKWTWFAIGYMTLFAWVVALMIYQFGGLITGELSFNVWTAVSVILLGAMLFQIFRPTPKYEEKPKGDLLMSNEGRA